ncbi:LysR family transcriptional regulator [Kaistia nematophila]|uniref:LysR family transcriptional regulator n=1 Tax=Kaistia nematophila TaxID=2994654 RepID=A0A9X3IK61_9HYPH|nr:LysR family transcriptional regulator [Kaistia nematophila]MCX5568176.1 LysR family transcriptional regulator [Kaistia nematophila]
MAREDFNDYLAFLAVAQERSFTKAAAKLGVSQSTLSHIIRRLEERLGLRLLMRTTRSVAPTEVGEKLMSSLQPRIEEIEADITSLLLLRDTPAGTVRLTVSDNGIHECVWPKLAPVLKNYPDLKVELAQENALVNVVEGRYDGGVRLGESVEKDMISVRIGPDWRLVVVGSPDYLAKAGVPQHPSELVNHQCINMRHPGSGTIYAWELEKDGQAIRVRTDGQLTFNSVYPMFAAVADGYGLAFLQETLVAEGVKEGRYQIVLDDWCPFFAGYHLYYPSRRQMSSAMAVVVNALRHRGPVRAM